jgi:uncharacterized protein
MPMDVGWPFAESPYHEGEHDVQLRLGVRDRMEQTGRRMIRERMTAEQRALFASLQYVLIGARDAQGQPWATLLTGPEGFVASPDSDELRIGAALAADDPAGSGLHARSDIAVLGIDLATRRRVRANGGVLARDRDGLQVRVRQAFGNCPKYIEVRDVAPGPDEPCGPVTRSPVLEGRALRTVQSADTFFIASAYGASGTEETLGADVSHRGGAPGFVRVTSPGLLRVPDYPGNNAFNTFGNLIREPRCGLLFVDFETGSTVQIAAVATILWEEPDRDEFPGARRLLQLSITAVHHAPGRLPLRWTRPQPVSDYRPDSLSSTASAMARVPTDAPPRAMSAVRSPEDSTSATAASTASASFSRAHE